MMIETCATVWAVLDKPLFTQPLLAQPLVCSASAHPYEPMCALGASMVRSKYNL